MTINEVDKNKVTPMMRQYIEIKEKNPDVIIFFRLGDFYEMFFEDAIKISRELELTLTGKSAGLEERIPMCGIPHHAANIYIDKLVEKGYKIGICDQLEDAKDRTNEAQEKVLSKTEEWAEAMKKVIENALAESADILEKSLTGIGFESLMDEYDKLNTRQEEFLTKTN